ncbi:putative permease [Granulicella aggregans]|uniref:Putative permease n=1 Tax=Granulicella aggregans TaxID=474949 RepID=A0A7W8E6S3_9BACT|nr:putative permease [Granulicella aggregans]
MRHFAQDLRFTIRQQKRAPGFTLLVVLTLALGIGFATAVFSVIDAVLLLPLPFSNQERLVFPDTHARSGYTQPWSWLSYVDARAQLRTFEAFAGYTDYLKMNLDSPSGPVSLTSVRGTDNFFTVFGIKPLYGRTFLAGEDQPGHDAIVVLSYEVWQSNFGGRPEIIGKTIRLDGVPSTVIGVMPAGFRFPLSARNAIYKPLNPEPKLKSSRGAHWMRAVGLLKPGVTAQQAQADFTYVLDNLGRAYPDTDTGRTVHIIPLQESVTGEASGPLKILLLAVCALLGIACVNVAGLLLARGIRREREMALRAAIGASRGRLLRQVVTEGLVLSAIGLVAGIALSWLLLTTIRTFLVSALARGADVHLNGRVVFFAALIAAATSVAASLAPALRLSKADPNQAMRSGNSIGGSREQNRLRSGFVITQVALSLVLLVISGLLLRNLHSLLNTPLGFDPNRILTTSIQLSPAEYEHRDPLATFYSPLLERVSHLPGVQAAGIINILPIKNWGSNSDIHIAGQPPNPAQQEMLAEVRVASSGYFDAMGIQLVRGRMLSPAEDTPNLKVPNIVVNEAFQKKFFSSGGEPVGARTDEGDKNNIVGLITDVRQHLAEPPLAELDWLIDEIPKDEVGEFFSMSLVIRSTGDPKALIPALRDAMHQVGPTVPFSAPETMADVVSESLVFERMENWLFGLFAASALLLAAIGLYGLTSHEVEFRTREIGVRMALGSSRGRVVRQILGRVSLLLSSGIISGWILTLALRQILGSVVQLHPGHDFVLLALLTLSLLLFGLAACFRPASSAAAIDPIHALRSE